MDENKLAIIIKAILELEKGAKESIDKITKDLNAHLPIALGVVPAFDEKLMSAELQKQMKKLMEAAGKKPTWSGSKTKIPVPVEVAPEINAKELDDAIKNKADDLVKALGVRTKEVKKFTVGTRTVNQANSRVSETRRCFNNLEYL